MRKRKSHLESTSRPCDAIFSRVAWRHLCDDGFGPRPHARPATRQDLCRQQLLALPRGGQGLAEPAEDAPPFRDLHKKYPVDTLQEALAKASLPGTHHAEFRLEPDQVNDVISYLKSLE